MMSINILDSHQKSIFTKNVGEILKIYEDTEIGTIINLNIEKNKIFYLGYIISLGYNIQSIEYNDRIIELTVKKTKKTKFAPLKKEGIFIKLPRTGKDGKRIYVYKLRTMQPYSQYLQDFLIEQNGFNDDGTIKNDFRITKFGKFARKYWIDELPMLFNFIKGDLKFIGVRPLSDSMLSQYPKEHLKIRHKSKPGLIPPYYIDKPKTFDEIIESERRYLDKYVKNPIKTDISYFFKFLKVVLFKGVRSS